MLLNNEHVLCEKTLVLNREETIELFELAKQRGLVFIEVVKIAYSPGFTRLTCLFKSCVIGKNIYMKRL